MTTSLRVDDKVAVVTGAAQGIGRAYALGLAEAGAAVVVVDIDPARDAVAAEIERRGGTAIALSCDVSDAGDVQRLAAAIAGRFDRVDIVVNNAAVSGVPAATPFDSLDPGEFDRVMAVNVKGMWLVVQALLPLMRRSEAAAVVNQSSIGGFLAAPGYLPYTTSKTAIVGVTKTLARELGPDGIRVNAIAPGSIATESLFRTMTQEAITDIVASQCLPRHQQPHDLVDPLLFLVSAAGRFVTGQTLVVDGGLVMLP